MKKLFLALSVLPATFSGYTSGAAERRTMPVNSDSSGTAVFSGSYD
jgi:hypothetical protein